jgi:hypothetical protein
MTTWNNLLKSTENVASLANADQSARVENLNLEYFPKKSELTFYASVSSSHKPSLYGVQVTFTDVGPTDGLTEDEIMQGYKPKPSLSHNDMLVRCSCPNYQFRFDYANRLNNVGTGKRFPIYHKKTDRKPYNPHNEAGICKHIYTFVNYLINCGFLVE